uniref:Ribonuclease H-like domain-containing protein n=1 Tax=Tanacetum cinerariifolium TaxID=118510 RepID=A0A6L2MP91_TANCI|nr:ribonuclease H-like domain-containing protein [Tanacetum cinerariifolium]
MREMTKNSTDTNLFSRVAPTAPQVNHGSIGTQETTLPYAFTTATIQDFSNGAWNMDSGVSSHLNNSFSSLSEIFNTYFMMRRVLLRCNSTGDLYPVTTLSPIPYVFLVSQHTWHQRRGHPGREVLRHLVSNNFISCNKEKPPMLCHACQFKCEICSFQCDHGVAPTAPQVNHGSIGTQETTLPYAFTTATIQDFSNGAWNMDSGVSSHLNNSFSSLSEIFNTYFMMRRVLLRCNSTGDLYPVTTLSPIPYVFLVSQHTWHQRRGHPGREVLRHLVSNNFISCNKEKPPMLCHACQNKIIISRYVSFNETVFPYGSTQPALPPTYTFLDDIPIIIPPVVPTNPVVQLPPEPITLIHNTSIQHHPDAAQLPTPPQQLSPTQVQTTKNQAHSPPSTFVVQQNRPTPTQSPTTQHEPAAQSPIIIPDPPKNPNPVSIHPMVILFRVGTNHPTEHLNLHMSLALPLPKSYRDAFSDLNWQNSMHDEYHALIINKTWTLVPRPLDTNIVRCMWLFRHKYLADGTLSRYKARLVTNGSTQLERVDVDETLVLLSNWKATQDLLPNPLIANYKKRNKQGTIEYHVQQNKMKFGYLHEDGDVFVAYSWERALSIYGDVYPEWCLEFFLKMYFDRDVDRTKLMTKKCIWFRFCGVEKELTLPEFVVLLGLYEEVKLSHRLFAIHFTRLEVDDKLFNHEAFRRKIGAPTNINPRTSLIREPLMRIVNKLLVGSLFHRAGSKERCQKRDMWLMSALEESRGINLAWVIFEHRCKHAPGLKENSLICGDLIESKTWAAKMFENELDEGTNTLLQIKHIATQPSQTGRQKQEPRGLDSSWGDWNTSLNEIERRGVWIDSMLMRNNYMLEHSMPILYRLADQSNFSYPTFKPPNVLPYPYPHMPYSHPYTHYPKMVSLSFGEDHYGVHGDGY